MTDLNTERKEAILNILHFIQEGGGLEEAKRMFRKSFDQVDASEIAAAERELIGQGLDPRKIQYLCNIHAETFKGHVKNTDHPELDVPGHPVHTMKQENIVIKSLVNDYLLINLKKWKKTQDPALLTNIQNALQDLSTIHKHYTRKETSIFPIMNKHGLTAPPEVMWGVDDKIRRLIGEALVESKKKPVDPEELDTKIQLAAAEVLEMIFKEEEIMIPMMADVTSDQEWKNVKDEEKDIGYTLIQEPMNWVPSTSNSTETSGPLAINKLSSLFINFKKGSLNLEQLNLILDILPFGLTFIDENDKVAYFGGGAHIYNASKNAIGNNVFSCHMPESRDVVKQVFDLLKSGEKDMVEYWFTPKRMGKMLYLRYYAVRDEKGAYKGVLEVAEDITRIKKLTGEKRKL